ncbi:hypothetical protein KC19_8G040800 [Ceratodon purpureus]|nr:hypothetical protein KC19_8G040800 [Ceratodon purpureus]
MTSQNYGYEPPFKPSRHFYTPDLITQPTLKCNAIPTKEQPWRAQRKVFPIQTGALSEDTGGHGRKSVAPAVPKEKSEPASLKVSSRGSYDCSSQTTTEKPWNPGRHQSGKAGSETTQQDFHPHRRRIPKGGSTSLVRHAKKGPGFYKRNDGEWLPPFRASTPEMVAHQAPGCVPWQCPKTGKKKADPNCRQGEWQPDFRSRCSSQSAPSTPEHRPAGLRHIHRRPDEWCPPWKAQQSKLQQHSTDVDAFGYDPLMSRNATINEGANCTHYLDDDEGRERQGEHDRGAESTEDEGGDGEGGEGEESNGFDGDEFCKYDRESYPSHEKGDCNVDNCDGYGDQEPGVGRPPASSNSWCAEDD